MYTVLDFLIGSVIQMSVMTVAALAGWPFPLALLGWPVFFGYLAMRRIENASNRYSNKTREP